MSCCVVAATASKPFGTNPPYGFTGDRLSLMDTTSKASAVAGRADDWADSIAAAMTTKARVLFTARITAFDTSFRSTLRSRLFLRAGPPRPGGCKELAPCGLNATHCVEQ